MIEAGGTKGQELYSTVSHGLQDGFVDRIIHKHANSVEPIYQGTGFRGQSRFEIVQFMASLFVCCVQKNLIILFGAEYGDTHFFLSAVGIFGGGYSRVILLHEAKKTILASERKHFAHVKQFFS
jgi:hypothetical protein